MGDPEEREQEEHAWAARAAGDSTAIAGLLDLIRNPPTGDERGRASEEAFRSQLTHLLTLVGRHLPGRTIDAIGPLTGDALTRATAIEVIGGIGDPGGLKWLVPLVDAGDLSEDEATWLASALGDIGTAEAKRLLERFGAHVAPERTNLLREIQIALDAIVNR
jgi:HEAT repeat protein